MGRRTSLSWPFGGELRLPLSRREPTPPVAFHGLRGASRRLASLVLAWLLRAELCSFAAPLLLLPLAFGGDVREDDLEGIESLSLSFEAPAQEIHIDAAQPRVATSVLRDSRLHEIEGLLAPISGRGCIRRGGALFELAWTCLLASPTEPSGPWETFGSPALRHLHTRRMPRE
jgi:hypothetical protein